MTKSPRETLQRVFLEGIADGGTGGSVEDVVSKAAAEIKEAVLAAVGEDELKTFDEKYGGTSQWNAVDRNNLYSRDVLRAEQRKAILTMFEGE